MSAAVLLLFVSAAAHAQESGASEPATAAAAPSGPIVVQGEQPAKEDKVVCRRETETGSIRSHRVCRTQSQIAQEREQGERTLDNARRQRQSQELTQHRSGG